MRLAISGDYVADWPAVSAGTKEAAGWRCVRCYHRFDPGTGLPMPCDDQCDATRGRLIVGRDYPDAPSDALGRSPVRLLSGGPHMTVAGLNYGVHHFDGRKDNNAWWNLMALCNSCHLRIQARVIPERPWLFKHSRWMIPYVCGFYAAYYGGEHPSRDLVERAPDVWLRLGQPWLYEDVLGGVT